MPLTSDRDVLPIWKKDKIIFNNIGLPNPLRLLVTGPSGSGKTILLLKMLMYNLDFDKLIICSPSLDLQKEYQIFIKALNSGLDFDEIQEIFRNQDEIEDVDEEISVLAEAKNRARDSILSRWINSQELSGDCERMVTIYRDPELMPSPEILREQFSKKDKILVIIDDCMKRKQNSIENLFIYGRPLNMQTIYLTQAFFEVPKDSIRGNCNAFIFFETSVTDLRHSFEQIGARGFDNLEDYKNYARLAWSAEHGYFYVDLTKKVDKFKMNSF